MTPRLNPYCQVTQAIHQATRAQGDRSAVDAYRQPVADIEAALAAGRIPAGVFGVCTCANCRGRR